MVTTGFYKILNSKGLLFLERDRSIVVSVMHCVVKRFSFIEASSDLEARENVIENILSG